MKKVLMALMFSFAIISTFILSGCNNGSAPPTGDPGDSPSGPGVVTPPTQQVSKNLEYELSEFGDYYILVGRGSCEDKHIRVPETYNGKPVKEIKERAFFSDWEVTGATIPSSITKVGRLAFAHTNISELSLPSSIQTLGDMAFAGVAREVYTSEGGLNYLKVDGNPYFAVVGLDYDTGLEITNLVIEERTKYVYSSAFDEYNNITSLTCLNENIEVLDNIDGKTVCQYLNNLTSANVPLQFLKDLPGTKLTEITINGWNETSHNIGTLSKFNNCNTSLKSINYNARVLINCFKYCTNVENIVLGDKVERIDQEALSFNTALKTISINNGLSEVGFGAFGTCENIENVYYNGTIEEYCSVYWGDNPLAYNVDNYHEKDVNLYINGENMNVENLVIPEGVTYISSYAFANLNNVKSITIPSLEWCLEDSFYGMQNLENIYYNGDISDIYNEVPIGVAGKWSSEGVNLYINGSLLREIEISVEGKPLLNTIFDNINSIEKITVNKGFDFIVSNFIKSCKNLTQLDILDDEYSSYESGTIAHDCEKLTKMTFPTGMVRQIPRSVKEIVLLNDDFNVEYFEDLVNIESIEFKFDGAISVPADTFKLCTKLTTVKFKSLSALLDGNYANEFATPLCHASEIYINGELVTELVVPENTSVKPYTFSGFNNAHAINISNDNINIDETSFLNSKINTLKVHADYLEAFVGLAIKNLDITGGTYIPSSVQYGSTTLETLTMADTIIEIGGCAFSGCVNLREVTLSENLEMLGSDAFGNCESLIRLNIKSLINWCNVEAEDEYSVPTGSDYSRITDIYLNGELLEELNFDEHEITIIKPYLFKNTSIKRVVANNVTEIGAGVFKYATNLSEVVIGDVLTNLGEEAFSSSGLTAIDLTKTQITILTEGVFEGCKKLTNIKLSENIEVIEDYAFRGCEISEITIPASVVNIGLCALNFGYSSNGTPVVIFKGIPSIVDTYVFNGTEVIVDADLSLIDKLNNPVNSSMPAVARTIVGLVIRSIDGSGKGLRYTYIDNYKKLTKVVITKEITQLASDVFKYCSHVTTVEFEDPTGWFYGDYEITDPEQLSRLAAQLDGDSTDEFLYKKYVE